MIRSSVPDFRDEIDKINSGRKIRFYQYSRLLKNYNEYTNG